VKSYYIASCLFTARYPQVSLAIQRYIESRGDIQIVRCCIPGFRATSSENRINQGGARASWNQLPYNAPLEPGDTVYSLCHNCTNIAEEQNEGIRALSLWELVDSDPDFVFPDCSGLKVTGITSMSPFATVMPAVTSITPQSVTTTVGTAPTLPKTVSVTYSDNTTGSASVLWDSITADKYAKEGSFDIYGTVAGTTLRAKCTVTVQKAAGSGGDTDDKITASSPKSSDNVVLLSVMIAVFAISAVLFIIMAVTKRRRK